MKTSKKQHLSSKRPQQSSKLTKTASKRPHQSQLKNLQQNKKTIISNSMKKRTCLKHFFSQTRKIHKLKAPSVVHNRHQGELKDLGSSRRDRQ